AEERAERCHEDRRPRNRRPHHRLPGTREAKREEEEADSAQRTRRDGRREEVRSRSGRECTTGRHRAVAAARRRQACREGAGARRALGAAWLRGHVAERRLEHRRGRAMERYTDRRAGILTAPWYR